MHRAKVMTFRRALPTSIKSTPLRAMLRPSKKSSPTSSRSKSERAVAGANVFQQLAIKNPAGFALLVSLANKILMATERIAG
jgi:hypothetical protein